MNLTVETTCTKEGFVKNFYAVGCSKNDDAGVISKAVHFCKQLVERAFAFIVLIERRIFTTRTTDGVNFVDEDDAGGFLLCLCKEVAHTTRTHTNEHFYEVTTCK